MSINFMCLIYAWWFRGLFLSGNQCVLLMVRFVLRWMSLAKEAFKGSDGTIELPRVLPPSGRWSRSSRAFTQQLTTLEYICNERMIITTIVSSRSSSTSLSFNIIVMIVPVVVNSLSIMWLHVTILWSASSVFYEFFVDYCWAFNRVNGKFWKWDEKSGLSAMHS